MLIPNIRDLTNVQWEVLDSLIPAPTPRGDGRGRPWKDRRAVLNGILWILRTGAPWADVEHVQAASPVGPATVVHPVMNLASCRPTPPAPANAGFCMAKGQML